MLPSKIVACSLILAAGCLMVQPGASQATAAGEENAATAAVPWTPVVILPSGKPWLFQGSDNKYNVAYELILNNFHLHETQVKKLEISDARTGKVVQVLEGKSLAPVFTAVSGSSDGRIDKGSTAIIWVNLEFEKREQAPAELKHRLVCDSLNQFDKPAEFVNDSLVLPVDFHPPLVISPPLRGDGWAVCGGYIGKLGHRRALFSVANGYHLAQRYAIDWEQLTSDHKLTTGDPKVTKTWTTYGQPALAVADATVYGVMDEFADQVPFDPQGDYRLAHPGGNSVTLDLGNGYYGFYAHLKPGSIKVKPSDRVKRGQQIAELGNTGNSFAPHLHFHVTDNPSPIASNGVPYLFDSFQVSGQIDDIDQIDKVAAEGGALPVVHSPYAGSHKDELPREGMVLSFPK